MNEHLSHYIQSLPTTTPRMVSLALPEKFDGDADKCRGFIRQVKVYFDSQEEKFVSEDKKCAFLMTLASGQALDWAAAVWETDRRIHTSFEYFIHQLHEMFQYPAGGRDISS